MCPLADLYLSIVLISLFFGLAIVYAARAMFIGRVAHARTDADGGSIFVNKAAMEMV